MIFTAHTESEVKQMTKLEAIEILRDTPIDIRSTREDDIHTLYATAQGIAIEALSAQPDLSGYSDRLWKSAYASGYERCRRDAIDAIVEWTVNDRPDAEMPTDLIDRIKALPSAQPEDVIRITGRRKFVPEFDFDEDEPERECDECIFKPFKQFQPERKKGEWIKISPANIYECHVCGQNVMTNDIEEYRFCHGCGADMRTE